MRGTKLWGAVAAAWTMLATAWAFGQGVAQTGTLEYAPPDTVIPLPLSSTRPEAGGLFFEGGFLFQRQTNPLKDQFVGVRGFTATNDQVLNSDGHLPKGSTIGRFIGTGEQALNVQQISGPNSYQPGWDLQIGWKLADGSAITFGWKQLTEARTAAVATLFPRNLQLGDQFQNTFLSAPVFNYPNQYNGPLSKVADQNGNAVVQGAAGIWNGASIMTIDFIQRFQDLDITYRFPVYENECYRISGLVGPRKTWIWERFAWRTTDLDLNGDSGPQDVGLYTNIVSNEMYGLFVGTQQEWWWGHGLAGMLELKATAYVDIVKERAKYELGTKFAGPANKRSRRDFFVVPEVEGNLGLMWYPIEGVQVKIGYDVMAFFNTISSPRPISFDYSGLNPAYERTFRLFDGFMAQLAISF